MGGCLGNICCLTAGQYGFAAVGTHRQVIALRDIAVAAGESFAITRASMAEMHAGGQLLSYEGGDPGAFREQASTRLGLDPLTMTGGSRPGSSGAQPSSLTSSCPTTKSGCYARRVQTKTSEPLRHDHRDECACALRTPPLDFRSRNGETATLRMPRIEPGELRD
jgi:hypothetical protein